MTLGQVISGIGPGSYGVGAIRFMAQRNSSKGDRGEAGRVKVGSETLTNGW